MSLPPLRPIVPSTIKPGTSGGFAKKRIFMKELRTMMYGFGDVPNPRQDSVEMAQASKIARPRGGRIRTEDMLAVLKRDPKKLGRVEELLFMNEELRKVRKAIDLEDS